MAARICSMNQLWNSRTGFERAAADDESIGVERIHHFVEEQTQSVGLHAENLLAQRIAFFSQTAHEFGRLVEIQFGQLVTGIARQEIGQDAPFDGGERAQRFQVAGASAVAFRL